MGVLKILAALKNTNIKVEKVSEQPPNNPSPAVSSISSYGSGTLLIHGQPPKVQKKKHVTWATGRKHVPARLANIIWSGLFLMVIIATVIVVAALAENIRRTLWTKVSYTDEDSALQSVPNSGDVIYPKSGSDEEGKMCVHRRILWEHGSHSSEIIHDMSSKWSAIVNHDEERCLIFDLRNSRHSGCPVEYPWDMDLHVGMPACRGPLAVIAPIRKIMHHICNEQQVNLTVTGDVISAQCSDHRIFQVDKVIIQYFDRNFRRVARRSVLNKSQAKLQNMITTSLVSHTTESSPVAADGFNSQKKHPHTSITGTKEASKTIIQDLTSDRHDVSSSKVAAKDALSHSTLLSKIYQKQTSAPSSIGENRHFKDMIPILINTIIHSKLTGVVAGGVKKELSESRINGDNSGTPERNDYWEVIYNYVDDAGNIVRASNFEEMKLGRK